MNDMPTEVSNPAESLQLPQSRKVKIQILSPDKNYNLKSRKRKTISSSKIK